MVGRASLASVYKRLGIAEVVLLSRGGLGATTGLAVLGRALSSEGRYYNVNVNVRGFIRLGPTIHCLRIADDQASLPSCQALYPTALLAFTEGDLSSYDQVVSEALLAFRSGLLLVNSSKPSAEIAHPYQFEGECLAVDITRIAVEALGAQAQLGVGMVAAFAGATDLVPFNSLAEAIEEYFSKGQFRVHASRLIPANLQIAERSYRAAKEGKRAGCKGKGGTPTWPMPRSMDEIPGNGSVFASTQPLPPASSGKNPFIYRDALPVWSDSKCVRCKYCYSMVFCPDWCWTYRGRDDDKEYNLAISMEFCKGCYVCAEVCPFGAVVMRPVNEVLNSPTPGLAS